MPLVLDATVGGIASNAYSAAADAIAVATYRIGGAGFIALTADQQVQALVTATRDIDSIANVAPGYVGGFIGEIATDTQALEWPRTGTDYADDELPASLVSATIELAISYTPLFASGGDPLNADPMLGNLKRKKTGPLEKEYFAPAEDAGAATMARFPAVVQRLLASLINVPFENGWGSGEVVRAS